MGDSCAETMTENQSGCPRDCRPPMITFSRSMWGDLFTSFSLDNQVQEAYAEAIEELTNQVQKTLLAANSFQLIVLVDGLERLGVAYLFHEVIEDKLDEIHEFHLCMEDEDLFITALVFRLLRKHRYDVSCDVFNKFMDENHKFKETLISDVEGLLSLYEAANIRFNGEDTMDEALEFTTLHLTTMAPQLKSPLKDKVTHALELPLHNSVPIVEILFYTSMFEQGDSMDELLLKLAKINLKFMQNLYKNELSELMRWWQKFDLKSKLAYARDSTVESYFWAVAFQFEPQYSRLRIWVTKIMQLTVLMDDTYDNYATLDEAQLFTDILEGWDGDMSNVDRLPDYMKIVYRFIMSLFDDYEREAEEQDKTFAIPYFKETVKQLGKAYNKELKWIMEKQLPSFHDFITNSNVTSLLYLILMATIPGLKLATQETVDWIASEPKILRSAAKFGRFNNDLGSYQRENREGKMLTIIDCYMKQYGVSKQETLYKFRDFIKNSWNNINKEWVVSILPKEIVELPVNYARAAAITYKNGEDGYTDPKNILAPIIVALFVDPINI